MRAFDDIVLVPPERPGRIPGQRHRSRGSARHRERHRPRPARRFLDRRHRPPLETHIRLAGPGRMWLTHRICVGEWASVYAAAWCGPRRLYRRFDFRSSRPEVAEIVEQGPDWAAVRGRSPGRTVIIAQTGRSEDSVGLIVLGQGR